MLFLYRTLLLTRLTSARERISATYGNHRATPNSSIYKGIAKIKDVKNAPSY